jgi:hypothetical protein
MHKARIIPTLICGVGLIVSLLFPNQTLAQELLPLNLTVSPATLQINTEPGKPVTATIKVLNNNPTPETLKIELGGFRADQNGDKPILFEFTEEHPERNWLTTNPSEVRVEPFSWSTVEVTLSPDSTAAFSYYYALMFERTTVVPDGTINPLVGIPAILVLTTVESPNMLRAAELVEFKSSKKLYEFLPAEFTVRVQNTGNVHVAPVGNVFIGKGDDKNVAALKLNSGRGYVLPNSARSYETSWDEGFPAYRPVINSAGETEKNSDGSTKYKLEWNPSFSTAFRIGKYTASLLMVYDDGTRDIPLEKTIEFWVIPWKLLIVAAIALFLLLTGLLMPIFMIGKKAFRRKTSR